MAALPAHSSSYSSRHPPGAFFPPPSRAFFPATLPRYSSPPPPFPTPRPAMPPFGSFAPFCSSPSAINPAFAIDISSPLPHCNLFFSSLLHISSPPALPRLFSLPIQVPHGAQINSNSSSSETAGSGPVTEFSNPDDPLVKRYLSRAGSGVGVSCDVGRIGVEGSLGDVAQIISCAICFLFVLYLIRRSMRRVAAVGRAEMVHLFCICAVTLLLKILTTGNVLEQGNAAISVLSAVHLGLVALSAWLLVSNALVGLQLVEDGAASSLLIIYSGGAVLFTITSYFALDQAFAISHLFVLERFTAEERDLWNIALMFLAVFWPYAAVMFYFSSMMFVVYFRLHETAPLKWFLLSFMLFAGAQAVQVLASHALCKASDARLTAGFLNTLLETAALGILFIAWRSITEDDWYEDVYGKHLEGAKYTDEDPMYQN